jgi:restriction system protein
MGVSTFDNQVAWARFFLAKAGLIDTSRHGVWTLTEVGQQTKLNQEDAIQLYRKIAKAYKEEKNQEDQNGEFIEETQAPVENSEEQSFRTEMVHTLQALAPDGFERLCKRILREEGFEEVTVTGRSNMAASTDTVSCE